MVRKYIVGVIFSPSMRKKIIYLLSLIPSLLASSEIMAKVDDISIWYETFGKKEDPCVLLIMGACSQGVLWPKVFCEQLADEGFYVIRYDHRDIGLSSSINFEKNPYDLLDMTKDAVAVLDAADVQNAHLFGVSMGSLIAELMAVNFPERALSLLLMGSTCDIRPMNLGFAGLPPEKNASLPPPTPEYLFWMAEFMKFSPTNEEEKLAQRIEGWNRMNGQKVPLDEKLNKAVQKEFLSRARNPQGIAHHIQMLRTEKSEELARTTPSQIQVSTIIIHGSEDSILPPVHGEALSNKIPNSKYLFVEGMGHVPNDHFYTLYISILKEQAKIK